MVAVGMAVRGVTGAAIAAAAVALPTVRFNRGKIAELLPSLTETVEGDPRRHHRADEPETPPSARRAESRPAPGVAMAAVAEAKATGRVVIVRTGC